MLKKDHLNLFLNDDKPKKIATSSSNRKIRSDKKHDIRIPIVTADLYKIIRSQSRERGVTMTVFTTQLIEKAINQSSQFDEIPYTDNELIVHAKVDRRIYLLLGNYADEWGHGSVRRASHRIFYNMLRREFGMIV